MSVLVERAGWSCVQDLGRPGYASSGVPRGGAFDAWALRAGNRLVGNDDNEAGIEIAMRGPSLRFAREAVVAIAGARFERALDGSDVGHGESFVAPAGAVLSFGALRGGLRAYVCVRGGIATPALLGSRSVSPRAGIGAMLADGDSLPLSDGAGRAEVPLRRLVRQVSSLGDALVRVIAGPQEDAFAPKAIELFYGEPFTAGVEADRVGVRLDGAHLAHIGSAGIDPEGLVAGAIQVPGDGRPIVLGPDCPATGGYAKIATVISADLCIIAQAKPGTTLRFEQVSVEQAREARLLREHALASGIDDV